MSAIEKGCPSVPFPKRGTVGHYGNIGTVVRTTNGTLSIKALAIKVLSNNKVGQSLGQPVGQQQNDVGQYYLDFFNERAGILEADSNQEDIRWLMDLPAPHNYTLREACEYKAFDYTIAEWLRKENATSIEGAITSLLSYGLPKVRGIV